MGRKRDRKLEQRKQTEMRTRKENIGNENEERKWEERKRMETEDEREK